MTDLSAHLGAIVEEMQLSRPNMDGRDDIEARCSDYFTEDGTFLIDGSLSYYYVPRD